MRSKLRRRVAVTIAGLAAVGTAVVAAPAGVVHAAPVDDHVAEHQRLPRPHRPANDLTTKWATTIEQERAIDPNAAAARRRRPDRRLAVQLGGPAGPADDRRDERDVPQRLVGRQPRVRQGLHRPDDAGDRRPGRPGHRPVPGIAGTQHPGHEREVGVPRRQRLPQGHARPRRCPSTPRSSSRRHRRRHRRGHPETPALVSPGGITQIDVGDPGRRGQPRRRPADRRQPGQRRGRGARRRVPRGRPDRRLGRPLRRTGRTSPPRRRSTRSSRTRSPKVSVLFTGHTHQAYVVQTRPVDRRARPARSARSCRPATTPTTSARSC